MRNVFVCVKLNYKCVNPRNGMFSVSSLSVYHDEITYHHGVYSVQFAVKLCAELIALLCKKVLGKKALAMNRRNLSYLVLLFLNFDLILAVSEVTSSCQFVSN